MNNAITRGCTYQLGTNKYLKHSQGLKKGLGIDPVYIFNQLRIMKYCWILYNYFGDNHLKGKIGVGWVNDRGEIFPGPIELCDNFRDDSKGRKELLREWSRILNDLKGPETEIYRENSDGTYTLLKNVGKGG